MGMYCCCEQKIRGDWECVCDWEGWISCYDYPEERKNKSTPIQESPSKSGMYLARYTTSYGDRYEAKAFFSKEPIRKDIHQVGWSVPEEVNVHWEPWDSEALGPYAYKKIEDSNA